MTFDPYAELGVERTATTNEVRKAYRRKAKDVHPDVEGGSEEAFQRVSRALVVLTDPRKRNTYDKTGRVEEGRADNKRAGALQMLDQFITQVVDEYVQNDFHGPDPRHADLVKTFLAHMEQQNATARTSLRKGEKVHAFLQDMLRRFSTTDSATPIERALERKIRETGGALDMLRESIEARELAQEIAQTYRFDIERTPKQSQAEQFGWIHPATGGWG